MFLDETQCLLKWTTPYIYDLATGKRVEEITRDECNAEYREQRSKSISRKRSARLSHDGRRSVAEGDGVHILSTGGKEAYVLPTSDTFSCWSPCEDLIVTSDRKATARLWKRRRPEPWWGVMCLWEFWLVAVAAAGLIWSACRDRRELSAQAPVLQAAPPP